MSHSLAARAAKAARAARAAKAEFYVAFLSEIYTANPEMSPLILHWSEG
ncbi:hypothetical protein [Endozoicomonas sp. YOMI1]|nr:hypothetical protein [Endozoicomonas sp. YOMI1]